MFLRGVRPLNVLAVLAAVWIIQASRAQVPAIATGSESQTVASRQDLLRQYCVGCHNDSLKTAGFSLEERDLTAVGTEQELWEKVLRKIRAGEMPPAGMPKPSTAVRKDFADYLETRLDLAAAAHPNPGRHTAHRLNRAEYSNVIRDLLAVDVNLGETLPVDDAGYGFDNIADVLSMSPILLER
jgi:mono/diheme cytochrome c family protein